MKINATQPDDTENAMTDPLLNITDEALGKLIFERASNAVQIESVVLANAIQSILTKVGALQHTVGGLPNDIVAPTLQTVHGYLEPIREACAKLDSRLQALENSNSGKREIEALSKSFEKFKGHFRQAIFEEASAGAQTEVLKLLQKTESNSTAELDKVRLLLKISQVDMRFSNIASLSHNYTSAPKSRARPKPIKPPTIADALSHLEKKYPKTYKPWKHCYDAGAKSYIESPNLNCASWSSKRAMAFKGYVGHHAKGHIIDVGCGPWGDPVYLRGLPAQSLTGIEPLPLQSESLFPVYQSFNEALPFPDKCFDTVINSTALDHCIDLEDALSETHRVLRSDGCFVVWYANVHTANKPKKGTAKAIDDYHMFHTNNEWFLPMMEKKFRLTDYHEFPASPGSDDVFAVFTPKEVH